MERSEVIVATHNSLTDLGLQAKNPDQSTAFFEQAKDWAAGCFARGFSLSDAQLMAREAIEQIYG